MEEEKSMEYEYCPRCEANLTLQAGDDNKLPYWLCRGCGEMLINPEVYSEDDVVWLCDGCGEMLNIQEGFATHDKTFVCKRCGFLNVIDDAEVYDSDAEYRSVMSDRYKGLKDEDILELSSYSDEESINDHVCIVRDRENGKLYVKKFLQLYDKSIYEHLMANPVAFMPKIVGVYESDNCLIIIEQYIEGRTLANILDERTLSEEEALHITYSVVKILDEIHKKSRPIVHRDIKPANVIVTPQDDVYLLDMNVAKWYDNGKSSDTTSLGTMHYAAPEQVGYGLSATSVKSDIYAVGVMLNVMLTGDFPKKKRAKGYVWDVIERCINLNPDGRYTAAELLEELEKLKERHR